MVNEVTIRSANEADAAQVASLANALNLFEGKPDGLFSAEQVRRDMFGDGPPLSVILAEQNGVAVGYTIFKDTYNSEMPGWGLWIVDIFVLESARGQGIGRTLMATVAKAALDRGATSVWWGVRSANHKARAFYQEIGARDEDARILELDGEALAVMADSAGDILSGDWKIAERR